MLTLALDRTNAIGLILAVAAIIGVWLGQRRKSGGKLLPMPPGRIPIIGHTRALGPERPWLKMTEWSQTYGTSGVFFLLQLQGS